MAVFWFSWVDETATTFGAEHQIEDEKIFSFNLGGSEANFDSLSIDIRNPRIGLLATGRKQWAWFASDDGLRFFGHLVGIPSNILAEVITLEFTAEPADYQGEKHTVAQTLKVAPYYDAIFLDVAKRDDPDAIMEGYSASWHVDRATHAVTISDWLIGEDGTLVFTADDVFYDSVEQTLSDAPLLSVTVEASVTWANASSGYIDFGTQTIESYTGLSLMSEALQTGASLGNGWSVFYGKAIDNWGINDAIVLTTHFNYQNKETTHAFGDTMSQQESTSKPVISTPMISQILTQSRVIGQINQDPDFHDIQPATYNSTTLYIPKWNVTTSLVLRYDAGRTRTENVRLTLDADLQPILTAPSTANPAAKETITLTGADVGLPIQSNNFITGAPLTTESPPIVDPSRSAYFPTDRGLISIQYLISLARAKLLMRSRAVQITFGCTFERALELSCRKSATLQDQRLPGGTATGKIISYQITGSGDDAKFEGSVTIGCAIGNDGVAEASAGIASYVNDGYVDVGYQYYDGAVVPIGIGDVAFTPPSAPTNAQGMVFPLTADQVTLVDVIRGSIAEQEAAINAALPTIVTAVNLDQLQNKTIAQQQQATELSKVTISFVLQELSIFRDLQLKPVDGEGLEETFTVNLSPLFAPKLIDLAAPAI